MDFHAYTRDEIEAVRGCDSTVLPERGTFCERCFAVVPEFDFIPKETLDGLRSVESRREILKCLMGEFHLNFYWAKIWIEHKNGFAAPDGAMSCQRCGAKGACDESGHFACRACEHEQIVCTIRTWDRKSRRTNG
jgi:hypothetical protein